MIDNNVFDTEVSKLPPVKKKDQQSNGTAQHKHKKGYARTVYTLRDYLQACGQQIRKIKDGNILIAAGCPMHPEHGDGTDTAFVWRREGVGFECKHNGCKAYTWKDVQNKLDPDNAHAASFDTKESTQHKLSQADTLISLVSDLEFFRCNGAAYVTIPVGNHVENYPVKSSLFRTWLQNRLYKAKGKAASTNALQDAIGILEARALFDGAEHQVYLRVAGVEGRIHIDLGNADWQCVEIDADGWRILDTAPVHFIRSKDMSALANPSTDGDLSILRKYVNVEDKDWILVAAWLSFSVTPHGPYPVLVLNGEQGSGKSFACRALKRITDNHETQLRRPPKDEDSLYSGALGNWLYALDNLSNIKDWLSDALCCISTGAGQSKRRLYMDDEEHVINVKRPLLINGITELVSRPDLLDRSIILHAPSLGQVRRAEGEMEAEFLRDAPAILGGLLDVVSAGLRELPSVEVTAEELPRMADFYTWGRAVERALGVNEGDFACVYADNRGAQMESAIESNSVATVLVEWIERDGEWTGTHTELLSKLRWLAGDTVKSDYTFPKTPKSLSNALKRLVTVLRTRGIEITHAPRKSGGASGGNRDKQIRISLTTECTNNTEW